MSRDGEVSREMDFFSLQGPFSSRKTFLHAESSPKERKGAESLRALKGRAALPTSDFRCGNSHSIRKNSHCLKFPS